MARQPRIWRASGVFVARDLVVALGGETHHNQVELLVRGPLKADAVAACDAAGISAARIGGSLRLDGGSFTARDLDAAKLITERPIAFIRATKDQPIARLYADGTAPEIVAHWRYDDGRGKSGRRLYVERVKS